MTQTCEDPQHSLFQEGYCPTCDPDKHEELLVQAPKGIPGQPTAEPYLQQPAPSPQSDKLGGGYSDTY